MKPSWFVGAAALLAVVIWRRRKLEPPLLVAAVLAAAGCVVYGTGVVHVPDLSKVLQHVGTGLGSWTYLLVGAMAFVETGAFLGFIAPGETIVLICGMVAGQGRINVAALIAIVWTSAILGDLASFELGKRYGRAFLIRHGKPLHVDEARVEKVEGYFKRRGGRSIVIGRFIGFVRPMAPFLAGSSGMPLRQFLAYDVIAAGLWSTIFSLLGFVFWHSLDKVLQIAKRGSLLLGLLFAVVFGIYAGVKWLRDPAHRAKVDALNDRITAMPVLGPAARAGQRVVEWARRPAGFVLDRVRPGDLGLHLTAMASIVAVGAFVFIGYTATIWNGSITLGDRRGLAWARDLDTRWLTDVARVVSSLGTFAVTLIAAVVGAGVLVWRRRSLEAGALIVGFWITWGITQVVKDQMARARPPGSLVTTSGFAFPSGHSTNAVVWLAIGVALWGALPGVRFRAAAIVAGIVLTTAIGFTRVYLRAHWWSDVAAGWGLGLAVYGLCGVVAIALDHRRSGAATLST